MLALVIAVRTVQFVLSRLLRLQSHNAGQLSSDWFGNWVDPSVLKAKHRIDQGGLVRCYKVSRPLVILAMALVLGACGGTVLPKASPPATHVPFVGSVPVKKQQTTTTTDTASSTTGSASSTTTTQHGRGAKLNSQAVEQLNNKLNGLQTLLGETNSDFAAGQKDK